MNYSEFLYKSSCRCFKIYISLSPDFLIESEREYWFNDGTFIFSLLMNHHVYLGGAQIYRNGSRY